MASKHPKKSGPKAQAKGKRLYAQTKAKGGASPQVAEFLHRLGSTLDRLGVWARNWGGILLIPSWLIAALCFCKLMGQAATLALWKTDSLWFFLIGGLIAAVQFYTFTRPVWLYVLGHETTHWLFAKLCFGKIHEFKVTRDGGYIVTDKTNWLIALSPYFFPIYAVAAVLAFWVVGKLIDLDRPIHLGLTLLPVLKLRWLTQIIFGALFAFHLFFTLWMIRREQPDLTTNDWFFSVNVILLANLVVLCSLVALVTPGMTWGAFASTWGESARQLLEICGKAVVFFAERFSSP